MQGNHQFPFSFSSFFFVFHFDILMDLEIIKTKHWGTDWIVLFYDSSHFELAIVSEHYCKAKFLPPLESLSQQIQCMAFYY